MPLYDFKIDDRRLMRAANALENFPSIDYMEGLAVLIRDRNVRRFKQERGPDGRRWKRWSTSYRERGAPFHANHRRLHLSGKLLESMTINRPRRSASAGASAVELGFTSRLAPFHHFGEGNLPVRELIGIGLGDVEAAGRFSIKHLTGSLRRGS